MTFFRRSAERRKREVARLDRVEQVAAVAYAILGDDGLGLGVGEVLDPLLRACADRA